MADSRQQIIGEINGEIQGAVDAFNDAIPQMEKSLVRKINLIIKDLDLNPNGTIKSTIANMKKMRTIEREMAVAFESAQYLGNVEKYTNAYDKTRAIEGKYFDKVLTDYSEPAIINEIQNQAVSTVTKELTGSNIVANVIDPVNTLVRQGIESGMEWDDLRSSIGDFLQGADGGVGALDRYTTTITNDSLNTYARTYENTIANREGIEWYEYVGREMTNTRDFCSTLDAQRWFHQSEIKGFLKGRIGNRSVPLYRKTGKPYGMKSSTTEKNFVQLAGGWNCGHHAYPVPTYLVPQKVRDKFETGVDAVDVDDALGVDDFGGDDIEKFTTHKQLNKFAEKKYGLSEVNLSNMDLSIAKQQMKQFDKLYNEYNIPDLVAIKTDVLNKNISSNVHAKVTRVGDGREGILFYDERTFSTSKRGLKRWSKKQDEWSVKHSRNWSVVTDSPEIQTTTHEFGHIFGDSRQKQYNKQYWKEIRKIKSNYTKEMNQIEMGYFNNDFSESEYLSKKRKIHVSEYSKTNLDEFTAESFAMYKLNPNPSPYATQVGKTIDKYFKK